jgi:two-component system CheB/CheR fusion protein
MSTTSNDIRHHLQTLVLLNATLSRTVDDAQAQKMFAMQGDAMGHLSDLMNSLLDITDFETGEVELDIEDVNLGEILQTLDDEFRGSAQAKSLHFEIDPSTDVIRTDRRLLTKALRSLVANAIRYTDEGRVAIRCEREQGGLRVTVTDTGIGIADDHLADIFDEFYRVEYNPAARDAGPGLGLTIVDRIARVLGVTLSVESKPGVGSSFALLLPVNA